MSAVRDLLAVLAAGRRAAEVGTGFGEGAAAIASSAASLVTVEVDEERAAKASARLAAFRNVDLRVGDWRTVLPPLGPFEFVFLDGGGAKSDPAAVELLALGGIAFLDDLTPGRPGSDPARDLWREHPDFRVSEILTTRTTAALLAARIA